MADVAAKIAALEDALASGELTVESQGDRLTYRNTKELREAIDYFKRQLPVDPIVSDRPGFGFSAVGFCRD
ncbi:hypothetical protein [uncultured Brevundimonas sp.]|jgi:hypothetical protein|uniref:phage head-tail joining protein n=1 Tax=uncultured Brevundimonas sp. TaxID=213418 RepID=UPI0025F0E987|nr:hypothetical protein [uncultured Brevundimonas sp.]